MIEGLSLTAILSLAALDAINPCALAVLTRDVLLAGMSFTVSVFVMYMVYGLVIVNLFQVMSTITSIRMALYSLLGVAAIILGLLNLKDFFMYKPGGFMTEMPMFLRPRVKTVISGITSPKGAFAVGLFVTLFLLPCTIGPYIIAGGILSALEILSALPWLLLYNAVFGRNG